MSDTETTLDSADSVVSPEVVASVTAIWASVLRRKDLAPEASFIALGGDSLLLIAMLTEIENTFDVYLEAEDILDDLTIRGVARAVERARTTS